MSAVKKYHPITEHARFVIDQQLPHLKSHQAANYFVEVQDRLVANTTFKEKNEITRFND